LLKSISLFGIGFLSGFVIAVIVGFLDPDTSYKMGINTFSIEKSISQNSPFAKCKQRQSALEDIISGQTADLSRVSNEISQLQKKAADTAMQFTKEEIVRVPNAELVSNCERVHAHSESATQIRDVQEKQREYSELQKAKAQKSDELDHLQQECFGLKK
jgi:predicted lipid-binding transport protein (Tim44 family)